MRIKRLLPLAAIAAAAAVLFSGCEAANELAYPDAPYPAQVENLVITKAPTSVVSLSPNLTDILQELGYGSTLIGRSDECDQPAEVAALPSVGSAAEPDVEKIAELGPNLLLSQNSFSKQDLETLSSAGVQVLCIPAATSFEGLEKIYEDLATVFAGKVDGAKKGQTIYSQVEREINLIVSKLPEKQSFFYAVDLTGTAATPDTFDSAVLSLFGDNTASGTGYTADLAAAKEKNPQRFFVAKPYVQNHLASSEAYKDFAAVKENRVFSIDPALLQAQSMRTVESVRQIASLLYPDVNFGGEPGSSSSSGAASSPASQTTSANGSSGTDSSAEASSGASSGANSGQ